MHFLIADCQIPRASRCVEENSRQQQRLVTSTRTCLKVRWIRKQKHPTCARSQNIWSKCWKCVWKFLARPFSVKILVLKPYKLSPALIAKKTNKIEFPLNQSFRLKLWILNCGGHWELMEIWASSHSEKVLINKWEIILHQIRKNSVNLVET